MKAQKLFTFSHELTFTRDPEKWNKDASILQELFGTTEIGHCGPYQELIAEFTCSRGVEYIITEKYKNEDSKAEFLIEWLTPSGFGGGRTFYSWKEFGKGLIQIQKEAFNAPAGWMDDDYFF